MASVHGTRIDRLAHLCQPSPDASPVRGHPSAELGAARARQVRPHQDRAGVPPAPCFSACKQLETRNCKETNLKSSLGCFKNWRSFLNI